jgi:WD40 repeat protein
VRVAKGKQTGDESAHAETVLAEAPSPPPQVAEVPVVDPRRYDLQGEFARGGLGRIVAAHDRRLRRGVAVKEPLPERAGDGELLLREAFVTAQLEHPGIVPVHDAGYWPDGTPFYAMKRVRGRSLAAVFADAGTLEARLALLPHVIAIADAIAYAHSQGVLHRDLKPSNILVGEFGETVVVDWGLAHWREEGPPAVGSIAGTPGYMAPEQARGEAVDERADVYALGAILHHALAGAPPHEGQGLTTEEIIAEIGRVPAPPLAERAPAAPADLTAIADKALAFDRGARYAGAAELAQDLRRFQTGQLVRAHRYGRTALALRWMRKNRLTVRVAGVLLLALLAIGAVSVARALAEKRREASRLRELVLRQAELALTRDSTETVAWLRMLAIDEENAGQVGVIAAAARTAGIARRIVRSHENIVWMATLSPDGQRLVTVSSDQDAVFHDVRGNQLARFRSRGETLAAGFSPAGDRVAVASADGNAVLFDRDARELVRFAPGAGPLWTAVFAPDGSQIASGGNDGAIHVWGTDGKLRGTSRALAGRARFVAFAPAGDRLIAASDGGSLAHFTLGGETRDLVAPGPEGITAVGVDRAGKRVAAAEGRSGIALWSLETGERLGGHDGPRNVQWVWFGPDDRVLWWGTTDGAIAAWTIGGEVVSLPSVKEAVVQGRALPDGERSIVIFEDGTVGVADRVTRVVTRLRGHQGSAVAVTLLPDGGFVTTGTEGTLRFWPPPPARAVVVPRGASAARLVLDPTGEIAIVGRGDGQVETSRGVRLADPGDSIADLVVSATGRVAFTRGGRLVSSSLDGTDRVDCPLPHEVTQLAFTREGDALVAVGKTGELLRMDARCQGARPAGKIGDRAAAIVFAPDGKEAALVGRDKKVWLWNQATEESRALGAHDLVSLGVAFSPDGTQVASGGRDLAVRLWPRAGGAGRTLVEHRAYVDQVVFSPDGRFLASAGASPVLFFTHLPGGETRSYRQHTDGIRSVAFSPDGRRAATTSTDGTLRLWDVRSGHSAPLVNGPEMPRHIVWSRDGAWLWVSGGDGTVRKIAVDVPSEPAALSRWLGEATDEHVDPRALEAPGGADQP